MKRANVQNVIRCSLTLRTATDQAIANMVLKLDVAAYPIRIHLLQHSTVLAVRDLLRHSAGI